MFYPDFHKTILCSADLSLALEAARLLPIDAAAVCGIHRTTFLRQMRGQSPVNVTCYRLLTVLGGWLPEPFRDWRITKGALWSPEDIAFEPGEIRSLPYLHALIAEYRRLLRIESSQPAPKVRPIGDLRNGL